MELSGKIIKELNDRINGELDYIQKNPLSDPNAFEMNDIMFRVASLLAQRIDSTEQSDELEKDFYTMMNHRLPQLTSEESDLKAFSLAEYFNYQLENMSSGISLGNDDTRDYLNSVCGVNLYINQRLRDAKDHEIVYDNKEEHDKLFVMRELFDDYGVSNNMMDEIDFALNVTPPIYSERKANFYKTR